MAKNTRIRWIRIRIRIRNTARETREVWTFLFCFRYTLSPSCVFVRGTWSKYLCAGILEQSLKARFRGGKGLSCRPWDREKPDHVGFKYLSKSLLQKRGGGGVVMPRDTSDGWPLLSVETETNGDSRSTVHIRGFLPWLVLWYRASSRDFCPAF